MRAGGGGEGAGVSKAGWIVDARRPRPMSLCHAWRKVRRLVSEFDFRYSNLVALGIDDEARDELALEGALAKRLTYRVSLGIGAA